MVGEELGHRDTLTPFHGAPPEADGLASLNLPGRVGEEPQPPAAAGYNLLLVFLPMSNTKP